MLGVGSKQSGWWYFKKFDIETSKITTIGKAFLTDTSVWAPSAHLFCNKTTDIVYCFLVKKDTCRLYEVSRNGTFAVREIGIADTADDIGSAAVDETSGNIFIVSNNALKKIDPETGQETTVTTYTNANPQNLYFNDNDGMFYAIDNSGNSYKLLRIEPSNGTLTIKGIIDRVDATKPYYETSFDRCSNQFILTQKVSISDFKANTRLVEASRFVLNHSKRPACEATHV